MSLLDIWRIKREALQDTAIHQIVILAGKDKLRDNSKTSLVLREYLTVIESELLADYAEQCLNTEFDVRGFVLQDIVNEMGRRLGFEVIPGLYQGKRGEIGYDGLWKTAEGRAFVIEVKTSDTYRIGLDQLARYRNALIERAEISAEKSSILIVIGNQGSESLEDQIRGSQYARNIRIISVGGLIRLMNLKEEIGTTGIQKRIVSILTPREYTKVDSIIEMVASTARDYDPVQPVQPANDDIIESPVTTGTGWATPLNIHEQCIERIAQHLNVSLVKQSRTTYVAREHDITVSCAVSQRYSQKGRTWYWFAFHPAQQDQLKKTNKAYAGFACGTPEDIFLFPFKVFGDWLEGLHQTHSGKRSYWHIHIIYADGKFKLRRKKGYADIDITQYRLG